MDKRGWPWKKKSSDKSDKVAAASEVEQGGSKKPTYIQISSEQYSHFSGLEAKVKTYEKEVPTLEDQIKDLSEKLATANAEITTKEELVKQHNKVAEEAVSGWEKAEAEALALKNHLESVTLSKLTAEDRATHLDGALKECMRQIRNLKEEHDQKLHDANVGKTKQIEKIKQEFEAKIAEFEQELLRSAAENDALSRSLQDRTNMLTRISGEKSQAEAEIERLKNNIESCEREISSLQYELHVVSKELEIRNEEKNMSLRSAEAANKQHMEGVKKIAKLETECQRLRGLVRKRLPGPAALAQMKLEVESWGREYGDTRLKRSPAKSSSPHMSPIAPMSPMSDFSLDHVQKCHKENELLTERLLAMEEETKMLKEALAKRNNELQASRNLCAKTASRLQILEAQALHRSPSKVGLSNPAEVFSSQHASSPPSLASVSEDGNDDTVSCAESWSTVAISELSRTKREKNSSKLTSAESVNRLELMDDFLEMEKLACLSNNSNANGTSDDQACANNKKQDEIVLGKDQESDKQCYMGATANKVSPSFVKSAESDADLLPAVKLRSRIYSALESVSKDADVEKILREIKSIVEEVHEKYDMQFPKDDGLYGKKEFATLKEKNAKGEVLPVISQELAGAVSQIHGFVLYLSREARAVHDPSSEGYRFSKKIEEFSATFDKVLCSEKTLVDFVFDLSYVLTEASGLKINVLGFTGSAVEIHSPDCIDKVALPENKTVKKDSSRDSYQNGCGHISRSNSDPEVPDDGNIVSGYESKIDPCKFTSEEFEEVKSEKEKLAAEFAKCTEDLEKTKSQLHETEQILAEVKSQLASAQRSNSLAETQLKCMAESYRTLETRSAELETEVNHLRGKMESLESELRDAENNNQDALTRCKELEEKLQRNEKCSVCSPTPDADLKTKQQDKELAAAAEKLAACQETILLLGKQLKALRPQAEAAGSLYHELNQRSESVSEDEPAATTNGSNTQDVELNETETDAVVSSSLTRTGAESPDVLNTPSGSEANHLTRSPLGPKQSKHRHTRSSLTSTPEKPSRGFSRFFSSKGKNSH